MFDKNDIEWLMYAPIIGCDSIYGTSIFSYAIVTCQTFQWGNFDFSAHYYVGNGQARTLQRMGLENRVWNIIERDVINRNGGLLDQLVQLTISLIGINWQREYSRMKKQYF